MTSTNLRITTWNCQGGFARKASHLDVLKPDIAVIQEMTSPGPDQPDRVWFGDNGGKGLGVVANDGFRLRKLASEPGTPKYVEPLLVSGPVEFLLFAVWTTNETASRYVRGACKAVDTYSPLIRSRPAVFAGDFNSNAIWDKDYPDDLNHSALVRRMDEHGLISAYHYARHVPQGSEPEPTYYHQCKRDQPFHIDYCFVPSAWAQSIAKVVVGNFDDWSGISDHRPLTVDFSFNG
jgi:hypothetical protein